jgi:Adenylate cyclase, family 3 (some proteins contain HAMP domain)
MSAFKDSLTAYVKKVFKDAWSEREGQVVPEASDLILGNEAVHFKRATILYADLRGSTILVEGKKWSFAAEVYKTYLHCATKIIKDEGGVITSYDGDRVMGVFIGKSQTTPAARAGLKINYAVQEIINPAMHAQYSTDYNVVQVVGIDTSEVRVARTGARGDNDLVWVGRAANYAAKLTELKLDVRTWVTKEAYDYMLDDAKFGGNPKQNMWKPYKWSQMNDHEIYGSTWYWSV